MWNPAFDAFLRDVCEAGQLKFESQKLSNQLNFCYAVVLGLKTMHQQLSNKSTIYAAIKLGQIGALLDKVAPLVIESTENIPLGHESPFKYIGSEGTFRVVIEDPNHFIDNTLNHLKQPDFSMVHC